MKLQPDKSDVQTLTRMAPAGWPSTTKRSRTAWSSARAASASPGTARRFDELGAEHFAQLAELGAELIIFGSGARIRFPQAAWLQPLMAQRTGVETMDTAAACRTYNILAQEGRHVVAALLIESAARLGQ